jgi:ATP-dependent Clp protease adaptor protein ClpS
MSDKRQTAAGPATGVEEVESPNLAPPKRKRQPLYNVILLNDDDHTYEYVILMLMEVFAYPPERGFQMAEEVDTSGRVILLTTTLEHAEFKQEQVHAYGRDDAIAACKGSMTCVLEPAPGT